jgi:hypothetical protein
LTFCFLSIRQDLNSVAAVPFFNAIKMYFR